MQDYLVYVYECCIMEKCYFIQLVEELKKSPEVCAFSA